jgi:hypothetical protein
MSFPAEIVTIGVLSPMRGYLDARLFCLLKDESRADRVIGNIFLITENSPVPKKPLGLSLRV